MSPEALRADARHELGNFNVVQAQVRLRRDRIASRIELDVAGHPSARQRDVEQIDAQHSVLEIQARIHPVDRKVSRSDPLRVELNVGIQRPELLQVIRFVWQHPRPRLLCLCLRALFRRSGFPRRCAGRSADSGPRGRRGRAVATFSFASSAGRLPPTSMLTLPATSLSPTMPSKSEKRHTSCSWLNRPETL